MNKITARDIGYIEAMREAALWLEDAADEHVSGSDDMWLRGSANFMRTLADTREERIKRQSNK